jgi:hypothetical protein
MWEVATRVSCGIVFGLVLCETIHSAKQNDDGRRQSIHSLLSTRDSGQVSDAPIRVVQRSPRRIVDSLKPGEVAILLEDPFYRNLKGFPPNTELEANTYLADAVVIAEVQAVQSRLTLLEDWITSTATASILNVVKRPTWWNAAPGERLSFNWDGGEMVLAGTRVTAVIPQQSRPVEAGKRYLLFLRIDPIDKTIHAGPPLTYEITDVSGPRRLGQQEDLELSSMDDVLSRIRGVPERPR